MPTYKRPPIYLPKSPSPALQKPAMSIFERLGVTRPTPKQEIKTKSPGLFGEKGYKTQWQLREFARKFPYQEATLPGTIKKLSKNERLAFIKELQERGKKFGQLHGLSEKTVKERIMPQLKKDKYKLHIANKLKEEKLLERKIRAIENLRIKGTFR